MLRWEVWEDDFHGRPLLLAAFLTESDARAFCQRDHDGGGSSTVRDRHAA